MSVLEISGLGYRLPDGRELLKNINIKLAEGEKCALIGSNGTGKTTLLKAICGEIGQFSGSVHVSGGLLYMPQDPLSSAG